MTGRQTRPRREKRVPKPLDHARLEELALAYVARFATSSRKLEDYLKRKLRERGWEGEDQPPVAATVARYVDLGYIDDAAYAKAKSGGLLRRGYGPRRVSQALGAAGIAEDIREDLKAGEGAQRIAALALARKRRFGPFAAEPVERDKREKQIAAMLRAGHGFDIVRQVMNAESASEAERWAAEAQDEDDL